jgi:hypothetical protein
VLILLKGRVGEELARWFAPGLVLWEAAVEDVVEVLEERSPREGSSTRDELEDLVR